MSRERECSGGRVESDVRIEKGKCDLERQNRYLRRKYVQFGY